jgi:hypothetical protein
MDESGKSSTKVCVARKHEHLQGAINEETGILFETAEEAETVVAGVSMTAHGGEGIEGVVGSD